MNDLMLFDYNGSRIRTVDNDGQIWWVLKDVCSVLELTNARIVAERLDEDERCKLDLPRQGATWAINESGLYSVILRSDKPEAKPFRRWVTHEVLPKIRRTGSYSAERRKKRLTWYGVEVMTVSDLDDYYGLSYRAASARLKSQYRYGLDYFVLTGDSLRLFKFENNIMSNFSSTALLRADAFKQQLAAR